MPTVPFAPANPRMMPERALVVADEKERRRQELEDLKAWALKDKEAIEKVDGRLARLVEALREKAEAADAERAKPDGVRDDTRVASLEQDKADLQAALGRVNVELEGIKVQLEIADRELQACVTELEAANHIILTEQRLTGEVPVTILYADDELKHFTDVRAAAIEKAEEQFEMKGVVAVESVIQPFWKGLDPFLEIVDETKLNSGGLGIILSKYPVLDTKKSEEFAAAFESLPLSGDAKSVAAEVKALVEGYRAARQALAGSDPKSAHKHLKELERAAVALKKIPSLWEAQNELPEVKKRREAFKKKEAEELERHQPEMMDAERKLWESLQETTDQELLVKAHLGEVAPAVPEHPIFDQLKIEDGRLTYGMGLFEKVGLPIDLATLEAGLAARLKDAQAIKTNKLSEHDLLENWKDDTLFLLDPAIHDKNAAVKAKIEERVKRLNLQKPSAETIQLLVHSVPQNAEPAELMKQLRHYVTMYFGALKDKNTPGSVAFRDPTIILETVDNKLRDLLHGFNDLVTGETQKKQLVAKIGSTMLHPDAKAIMGLIATLEGITVVDPAKLAKAAEDERKAREFVEGFVASMERTETLVAERAILHKDTAAREALVPQVANALEAHKGFQATLKEIEHVRPLIIEYLLQREMPSGGEDKTERKQFEANWPTLHEREVRVKKTQEDAAKRALLAAEKARKLTEADPEIVQLKAEITKVETLAGTLAHIDINPNALVVDIAGRDAILKQIPKIDVDGKEYSGKSLVEAVLAAGPSRPLEHLGVWLPKAIKELTLDAAYGHGLPDAALAAAYMLVEAEAATARTAAEWLQQNFAGRPEKGWFGMNYKKDDAWKAELDQQVKNVRAEVQRILLDLTPEREQADTANLQAKLQHHPNRDRYKANLAKLTARENTVKEVLALLDKALPGAAPDLIGAAYKGLRQVVHTLTNEEPAEHIPDPQAFGLLIKSLERIKQDPATSVQLLAVLERDHDHAVHCIGYAKLVLPGQLTAGPEIDLAGKKAKLVLKSAKIGDFQKEEADKQAAYTVAAQELARVEAETLMDGLAKFDLETSQHITKVIDPKGVLTQQDEIQLNQDAAAAEKLLGELEPKLKSLIDQTATHYTEWLTKKGALTTLTRHPTELEKVAVESALKAEQALFTIFEKQKATSKMTAAQFSAWYQGLRGNGAAGLRVLTNELVPGLST